MELKPLENEIAKRIDIIKRTYAKKIDVELKTIDEKIDLCNRKLAWNLASNYWKNRLSQFIMESQEIMTERDTFLTEVPTENREVWLTRHASWLGIELEPLPVKLHGSTATTKAVQELWGVTDLRAKKIVSIIIVITVECGILLMSLLAKGKKQNLKLNNHKILDILKSNFDDSEIERFLDKSLIIFKKHGRLPLSSELGKRQREIRKIIIDENIQSDFIQQLVENSQT